MDETTENNIMETNSPPLTWRDGAIPLLALGLAWLFWTCFDPGRLVDFGLPHLGVLVLVCAHFAAVFLVLGRRAHINAGSVFCTAAALALGVSAALYDSNWFTLINCFTILLTAAMATFALSGQLAPGRASALLATAFLSFIAFFGRLGHPFRALGRAFHGGKRRLGQAALGLLIAIPMLGVVLWLLASADAVFGGLFARLDLSALPEDAVMRAVRVLPLALFLASALYYVWEAPAPGEETPPPKPRRAALFLPVTGSLDIVYIIFCAIQIKYLFGGAVEASMAGGWAEYARSGFFQLVAVTAINITLCLLGTDKVRFASSGGKLLRALDALLLALTAVILASAFRRMQLYIAVYGLSVLRLATLWAMTAIAFGILAAGWKLYRPDLNFFRAAGGFALGLWCLLCLAGPGRVITNYNVDHYLSGQLEEVDITYLSSLSADALPALRDLAAAGCADSDLDDAITRLEATHRDISWTHRSLSAYLAAK